MQRPDFYVKGPTPCSVNPDIFVPEPSQTIAAETREAKKICKECPYKAECLAWALHNNEVGVWGGTSDRDRAKLKRAAIRTPRHVLV